MQYMESLLMKGASKRGFTGVVRVVKTPAGEAPIEIRKCWVNLVLPCSPVCGFPGNGERETGVLTDRQITYGDGKFNRRGISVPQLEAIGILELSYWDAAQFWKKSGFPKPEDACFCFGEDEVEIVSGVRLQTLVCKEE
jgi:hypothetical protein